MAGLMGYLLALERSDLAALAERWDITAEEASAARLYGEMTDLWSVSRQSSGLDARSQLVLDAVRAAGRQGITLSQLGKELPLGEMELQARVEALTSLALVVERESKPEAILLVPDEVAACLDGLARLATASDPSSAPVRVLLEDLSQTELQRLAERWNIDGARTRLRRELLPELEQRLVTRESARQAAASLSPDARRVLTALVRLGGRLELSQLADRLDLGERALRAAARELGELFFARQSFAGGVRALFVPVGVGTAEMLPGGDSPPPLRPVDGPPLPENSFAGLWDLLTMLAFARDLKQRAGRLPLSDAQQRRLIPYLRRQDGSERQRLAFLAALASGLGLTGDAPSPAPLPRLQEWRRLDFRVQTLASYRWWLGTDRWRDGMSQGERDTGGPLALAAGRERLIAFLAECEPARWYSLDELLRTLRAREPLLFRDRQALLEGGGPPALERVSRYWDRWDGKAARGAIGGALTWLEIVARAEVAGREIVALTPLGAWAIGRRGSSPPTFPSAPSLAARSGGDIEVVWPDAPTIGNLLEFARQLPGEEPRFMVDQGTVTLALARGMDAGEMLATLERRGQGLDELAAAVRRWTSVAVRLRLTQVALLEAENPEALDRLMASPWGKDLRLHRLGPLHAQVGDDEALAGALDRLRSEGYLIDASV